MNRIKILIIVLAVQFLFVSCNGMNSSTNVQPANEEFIQQRTEEAYVATQEIEDTLATLQWETTSYLIEIESVGTPYLSSNESGNFVVVPVQIKNYDSVSRDLCLSVTISVNLPAYDANKVIWSSTYSQADFCGNFVEANTSTVIPVEITMVRRFNSVDDSSTASAQPSPKEIDNLDDVTYNQFCVSVTAIDGNNVDMSVWKEHASDSCEE